MLSSLPRATVKFETLDEEGRLENTATQICDLNRYQFVHMKQYTRVTTPRLKKFRQKWTGKHFTCVAANLS